mmetsp:Transcript_45245/g.141795  ORF Transcript_45245/g.141795 Transcript_45245/m.141795 type:complete len:246 (+) Transcript_45245:246-983(+)
MPCSPQKGCLFSARPRGQPLRVARGRQGILACRRQRARRACSRGQRLGDPESRESCGGRRSCRCPGLACGVMAREGAEGNLHCPRGRDSFTIYVQDGGARPQEQREARGSQGAARHGTRRCTFHGPLLFSPWRASRRLQAGPGPQAAIHVPLHARGRTLRGFEKCTTGFHGHGRPSERWGPSGQWRCSFPAGLARRNRWRGSGMSSRRTSTTTRHLQVPASLGRFSARATRHGADGLHGGAGRDT